jgi:hypothetical protein
MLGSRKWQLALLRLVLAQALVLQAVLPSWGHVLQPGSADAFFVLCRIAAEPAKAPDGSQPQQHHNCASCCLAALTGGAVPVPDATVSQPGRRFTIVLPTHRDFEPERDSLSSAWSARGPPLVV